MKIVFIGDSITEGDRDLNNPTDLGTGFVKITADKIRYMYPANPVQIVNKGVSGTTTATLLERIDSDVIAEHPDVVVMMIGINDCSERITVENSTVTIESFKQNYEAILDKIRECGAKIIALEPFLLPVPDKRRMRVFFDLQLDVLSILAEEKADLYIAYDEMFNGVCGSLPYSVYSTDGIHPTHRASRLIADNLIRYMEKIIEL